MELTPELVLKAYRIGVFPMADDEGQIGWYQPDPRTIIPLDGFHVSRSLAKLLRQRRFEVSFDQDFAGVIAACADRPEGTWIDAQITDVFTELHRLGWAHSVECWENDLLVGGAYGIALGNAFMAESMFHRATNASKVALHGLITRLRELDFELFDTQYLTPHLASLGAIEISNAEYQARLERALSGSV